MSAVSSTITIINTMLIRSTNLAALLLLSTTALFSQGTTKEGYTLQWDKAIAVVPDSLANGKMKFAAWTIPVYETDGNTVMDLWKTDMKAISLDISGSRPVKATGTRLPFYTAGAITVMAHADTDKKADLAKLTLAFAMNDSTPLPTNDGQETYMRELAVKYNRAVVQMQIETYSKKFEKTTGKLDDAKGDVAKTRKSIAKTDKSIEKSKVKMSKLQSENAHAAGEIAGLEKKFSLTNDPKDLQRLTKARQRLAKGENSLASEMKSEAKLQGQRNKYTERLGDQSGEQEGQATTQGDTKAIIDALKRKQDNIQ